MRRQSVREHATREYAVREYTVREYTVRRYSPTPGPGGRRGRTRRPRSGRPAYPAPTWAWGLPGGTAQIKDGKLQGDNVTFWITIDYQGSPVKLVYKGKVAGDEIKFEFGTEDGSWGTQFTARKA